MELLAAIWIFLPAGLANTAPVIANNIPLLKTFTQPLDGGKTFRGKRIFGSHKTVRGLFAGILMGALVGLIQFGVYQVFSWPDTSVVPLDYDSIAIVGIAAVLGFGAIAGDAVKSFFKRQVDIAPGHNWFVFDQADYLVGSILISLVFFQLSLASYIFVLCIGLILHPVVNVISWLLHLQDEPL